MSLERAGEWYAFSTKEGRYCRRLALYEEMEWGYDVGFENCTGIAAAPLGGPVAIAPAHSSHIDVYTNSGRHIKTFHVPSDVGSIHSIGWTKEEAMVVLTYKHQLLVFELGGFSTNSQGQVLASHSIKMGRGQPMVVAIRPGGVFTVDAELNLASVLFEERKEPELLDGMDLSSFLTETPSAIEVLPHEINDEDETLVFVAPGKDDEKLGTMIVANLSAQETKDLRVDIPSGVATMRVSADGTKLALYTFDSTVRVVSTDFSESPFQYRIGCRVTPIEMHWCGEEFAYLTFSRSQVDPNEDPSHFSLIVPLVPNQEVNFERIGWDFEGSGLTASVAEVDGVRIITETGCHFVESVPKCLSNLFRLGGDGPTSAAAEAHRQFSEDNNVHGIITMRDMARHRGAAFLDVVDELIDAACAEFDIAQQEKIFAIAAFAKTFIDGFDSESYVDEMKRLKMLNAVRAPEFGVTLSTRQYRLLSGMEDRNLNEKEAQVLVDRLLNRHEFQLSFDIADMLRMRIEKVLVRWSCVKVQHSSLPDDELRQSISRVLSQCTGASFTDAALTAHDMGRQALAIQLLHDEPRSQNKVMLFLQMQQDELALEMAMKSRDADLVYLVLLKVLSQLSIQGVVNTFARLPDAQQLLTHAARLVRSWDDRVRALHADTLSGHLTAQLQLERLVSQEDMFFVDSLREEHKVPLLNFSAFGDGDDNEEDDEGGKKKKKDKDKKDRGSFWGKVKKSVAASDRASTSTPEPEAASENPVAASASSPVLSIDAAAEAFDDEDTETVTIPLGERRPPQGRRVMTPAEVEEVIGHYGDSTKYGAELNVRWCKNHILLLKDQDAMSDRTAEDDFLGSSIAQTIALCLQHGMEKEAEQTRNKFGVSDKKYWYIKLKALCAAGNWDAVDKMGGSGRYSKVKSPIGFLPFIEELAAYKRDDQAAAFVTRLPDLYERVEWYCNLDNFQMAVDEAYKEEDEELLKQIYRRASNPSIHEYIKKKLAAL